MMYLILLLLFTPITQLYAPADFTFGSAGGGAAVNNQTDPDKDETVITESTDSLTDNIPEVYTAVLTRLNAAQALAVSAQNRDDLDDVPVITLDEVNDVIDEYPTDSSDLTTLHTNLESSRATLHAYFDLIEKEEPRFTAAQATTDYDTAQKLELFTEEEEAELVQAFAASPPLRTLLNLEHTGFHRTTLDAAQDRVNPIVIAMQEYYALVKKKEDYIAAARIAQDVSELADKPDEQDLQDVQLALEHAQLRADDRYTNANTLITESNDAEDGITQFFEMKQATAQTDFSEATNINPLTPSNPEGLPVAKTNEELQALVRLLTETGLENRAAEIQEDVTDFNAAIQAQRDILIGVTEEAANRLTSVIALEDVGDGNALRVGPSSTTIPLQLSDTSRFRSVDHDDDPTTDLVQEVVDARRTLIFAAQSSDGIQIHLIDALSNEYRLLINAEGIYRVVPMTDADGALIRDADNNLIYEQSIRPFNTSVNFSQHPDNGTLHDSAYQLEIRTVVETLTEQTTDANGDEVETTRERVHIITHLTQQLRNTDDYGTLKRRAHISFAMDVADGTTANQYLPTTYRVGSNATALTVEMLSELPPAVDAKPQIEEAPVREQQQAFDITSGAMQQQGGYFGRSVFGRRKSLTVR